ncbi:hypothetical protein EII29_03105 [Leptotrichia sp. OH3620_COT-345]|uniref:hypothetical protein n=1 Tax=Leptotrichia sp. OH3620_COT-345 TaxID=2491048 RepID=UPI000F64C690|nr:hypothetical protein [Leptotrichia sp. OH3620_COT-345]RRD40478.1 hypothetical protein EII29_03105 [Leptotrichia sp. OH3620_COT-345]
MGKNGEKVLYGKTDYFFIPHAYYPNQFMAIWYKNNDTWKSQVAGGYPKKGFELFRQDFVKTNYLKIMEKIKNGGTVEFLFNFPKRVAMEFIRKKEREIKIKVNFSNI